DDATTITSGGLTVASSGELVISAGAGADSDDGSVGRGATLTSVTVTDLNSGTTEGSAGIEVTSGATLALDGAATISGGGSGTLEIATSGHLLINSGDATLNGVIVDDDGAGATNGIEIAAATLTLTGATQILGGDVGTLTIDTGGILQISAGATLDGVVVTDNATGAASINVVSGSLVLDDATTITSGGLTVASSGELVISAGAGADSDDGSVGRGATLTSVTVTDLNSGTTEGSAGIEVTSGATLALDGAATISGGGSGTLEIATSGHLLINSGDATLNGVIVDDDGAGATNGIEIAAATLTLTGATQILGGDVGTLTIDTGGILQVSAGATLVGVVVTVNDTGGASNIIVSVDMVFDDATTFTSGGLTVAISGELVISAGAGADSDDGSVGRGATLTSVTVTDLNSGTTEGSAGIEVTSGATLTLNGATTISGGGSGTL